MPWCEECSKYLAPTALTEAGECPACGRPVGEVEQRAADVVADERAPWHFKLLVGALVLYLGWRLVQLVGNLL